jgi:transposase
MRPRGPAKVLESRRWRALALLKEGLSLNEVARRLACAARSVMRWRNAFRHRGQWAFHVRSSPGRPPKLNAIQRRRLVGLLLQGPLAHGYQTGLWTTLRITEVIRKNFGLRYSPGPRRSSPASAGLDAAESRSAERSELDQSLG